MYKEFAAILNDNVKCFIVGSVTRYEGESTLSRQGVAARSRLDTGNANDYWLSCLTPNASFNNKVFLQS